MQPDEGSRSGKEVSVCVGPTVANPCRPGGGGRCHGKQQQDSRSRARLPIRDKWRVAGG